MRSNESGSNKYYSIHLKAFKSKNNQIVFYDQSKIHTFTKCNQMLKKINKTIRGQEIEAKLKV